MCGAWERSPAILGAQKPRSPAFPLTLTTVFTVRALKLYGDNNGINVLTFAVQCAGD